MLFFKVVFFFTKKEHHNLWMWPLPHWTWAHIRMEQLPSPSPTYFHFSFLVFLFRVYTPCPSRELGALSLCALLVTPHTPLAEHSSHMGVCTALLWALWVVMTESLRQPCFLVQQQTPRRHPVNMQREALWGTEALNPFYNFIGQIPTF